MENSWNAIIISCEVNLILPWSSTGVITNSTCAGRFTITDTKLYVPVVTLSTKDNAKRQFKSGFKRAINRSNYQSDSKTYAQNKYLNHLLDPSFQGVNRLFALCFGNENGRASHSEYYLPKVKQKKQKKNYNMKIYDKNFFKQPINSDIKTYENISKIAIGLGDDYTTGCLISYLTSKKIMKFLQ